MNTHFSKEDIQMANRHEKMPNITNHQGNANQNYKSKLLYLSEWLESKRQETTSVDEDVEKKEPLCTIGGNVNWCSRCGKQHGGFSKN